MSLIYFINGILVAVFALPIIQSIAVTACSFLRVKITENNCRIEKLKMDIEPTSSHAIGFQMPEEMEYYDDDYDSDMESQNRVIGFYRGDK